MMAPITCTTVGIPACTLLFACSHDLSSAPSGRIPSARAGWVALRGGPDESLGLTPSQSANELWRLSSGISKFSHGARGEGSDHIQVRTWTNPNAVHLN